MKRAHLFLMVLCACGGPRESESAQESEVEASGDDQAGDLRGEAESESEDDDVAEAAESETPAPARGVPSAADRLARLLQTYVTADGFRYSALAANAEHKEELEALVAWVGDAAPGSWTHDRKLAFYINAYNILTLAAAIERWPLDSVMNVPGFFDEIEHQVAGEAMTLNHLENEVIRTEEFSEPRIHFAVNCASKGCPPLRAEPYEEGTLDAALEEQTRLYLRATTEVRGRRVVVSKLFEWFADDFTGGVRDFVAQRLEGDDAEAVRSERTRLRYAEYDWAINAAE